MALEITYWSIQSPDAATADAVISSETRTLSASSAQSGVTPDAAAKVSIVATENARFEYSSANPTASASSAYINSGERL